MAFDFRTPQINGTEKEQLEQIKSYLMQFIPQLQWALNTLDTTGASGYISPAPKQTTQSTASIDSAVAFSALKPLIIKSAEIVEAYYNEISTRLEGKYIAKSDFGTFIEETEQSISQSSTDIKQLFSNMQSIITEIESLNFTLAEVNAHIKTGLLYYDDNEVPVYGLEIGQETSIDGVVVFNKFARFTADRLSFYDQNDQEIAYISDYKLYINHVQIIGSLQEGGYKDFVTSSGGIVTKWVGGV